VIPVCQLYDFDDVLRTARKNYAIGTSFINGAVVLIEQQIVGARQYPGSSQKLLEFANEFCVHWGRCGRFLATIATACGDVNKSRTTLPETSPERTTLRDSLSDC